MWRFRKLVHGLVQRTRLDFSDAYLLGVSANLLLDAL
jgi:hypothetical protein